MAALYLPAPPACATHASLSARSLDLPHLRSSALFPLSRATAPIPAVSRRAPQPVRAAVSESDLPAPASPITPRAVSDRRSLLVGALAVASAASLGVAGESRGAECELQESPSGLQFCDVAEGTGDAASAGTMIKAHYSGRLLSGTVFDSSYGRGRPLEFRVGVGQVIRGWDLGILGGPGIPPMKAGGKRTLRIPADLAYGSRGAGCRFGVCRIPPGSDLIFDVEYLGVV